MFENIEPYEKELLAKFLVRGESLMHAYEEKIKSLHEQFDKICEEEVPSASSELETCLIGEKLKRVEELTREYETKLFDILYKMLDISSRI